jgi:hypothetical protein
MAELLPAADVVEAAAVVVPEEDPPEPCNRFPSEPIFGSITTTATTAIRTITMIPATRRIFFLFVGFFGRGGVAVGMDEGTSGVGGRSFGEKSRGITCFFAGGAAEGTAVVAGCSGMTGVVENGA